jgi:hypothetical protein
MRHRREEIRPGILYQGFDLASHEDFSCQPDLNHSRYLERSAGPSLQHRTARMPRHLTSGRRLDGCTIIPHARAIGSEGCDQSYQRRVSARQSRGSPCRTQRDWPSLADSCFFIASCTSRDLQCGSFWYFAERGEAPERNEKLARERDDRNSAMAAPVAFDAVLEP